MNAFESMAQATHLFYKENGLLILPWRFARFNRQDAEFAKGMRGFCHRGHRDHRVRCLQQGIKTNLLVNSLAHLASSMRRLVKGIRRVDSTFSDGSDVLLLFALCMDNTLSGAW